MTEMGRAIARQTESSEIPGSVGFIRANRQIRIVDLTKGKNLGPNKIGEIWIKSSLMMIGYFRNSEATKEAVDNEGWYNTKNIPNKYQSM